jgi:SAM-dependent methyltransferase
VDDATRRQRARLFGLHPQDYDRVRPGYPEPLFDDLFRYARPAPAARLLEIGCGTGQATRSLLGRDVEMTCLEPSDTLSAIAQASFREATNVDILQIPFESLEAAPASFDVILAATSFHWLDPETRLDRCARLLRRGGTVAIVSNNHPGPHTGFFEDVQVCYDRHVPEWSSRRPTSANDGSQTDSFVADLGGDGRFTDVTVATYDWTLPLTAQEYGRLLHTFSDHVRLGESRLTALVEDIQALVDERYRGVVDRPYRSVLRLARRG